MSKSCMSCTFRTGKLCYNGSYRNERRMLSMNSPFWSLVMRYFLEFFSMVPCAVLCFLPVQDRLRRKPLNLFLTGIPLSLLWAFAGGLVCSRFRARGSTCCSPFSSWPSYGIRQPMPRNGWWTISKWRRPGIYSGYSQQPSSC